METVQPRPIGPLRPVIAPSVLAADFGNLLSECNSVLAQENGGAEWLHFDIMDGHFVPNIALGPPVVASMRRHLPRAFLDVHMMVTDPARWIAPFKNASLLTFHIEASQTPRDVARAIRQQGQFVGVALKPHTPAASVFHLCDEGLVDMVLVMTVEPGFGGQKFMVDTMPKVSELRSRYQQLFIEVDGGLSEENARVAAAAGANVIVAGTSIFRAQSRQRAIEGMRGAVAAALATGSKI